MKKGLHSLACEAISNIYDGEPYSLFGYVSKTGVNLNQIQRKELQDFLYENYKRWANTWVLPSLFEIANKTPKTKNQPDVKAFSFEDKKHNQ